MFVHLESQSNSLFDRVGGDEFFASLVERFYARVEQDPLLRPLYHDDLAPAKRHLALFLAQYWGGSRAYSDERGHPRLRMRHFRFHIGQPQRDAWMRHMREAVEESSAPPPDKQALLDYFDSAATSLINQGHLTQMDRTPGLPRPG